MFLRRHWRLVSAALFLWVAAVLLFILPVGQSRRAELGARLEDDGRAFQRLLSGRADQHEAHLTALAALAAFPDAGNALREVAEGIMRFYPRVTAIDVVAPQTEQVGPLLTTREGCITNPSCSTEVSRATAAAARGASPTAAAHGPGRYLLAKRVGTGTAARALALEVEAERLLEGAPADVVLSLDLPDGTPLLHRTGGAPPWTTVPLAFGVALDSASQPLLLRMERHPSLFSLVPWAAAAAFAAGSAVVIGLALGLHRLRQLARDQRRRAELNEHAVRLAHAGRVNALGEMASGIAHELTQPLTAILSTSQAALRLARRAEPADRVALRDALEANVRFARRAGDILARVRGWAEKDPPPPGRLDVNAVAHAVAGLLRRELEARGVELATDLAEPAPLALGETVQAEQVVHNLLRNAAEALETNPPGMPRRIALRTRVLASGGAEIVVEDTGPGVSPEARERLFEAFFTTKPGGMGLGLSLCRTMVERMGGRIEAGGALGGGARFTVRLASLGAAMP